MEKTIKSYDGTDKGAVNQATDYWTENRKSPEAIALREKIIADAGSLSALNLDYEPEIVADCSQLDESQWLALRNDGIGGSDCSCLYGDNKWKNNVQFFNEKIGKAKIINEYKDDDKWFIFEYGHINESLVAKMFEKKTGFQTLIDSNMYRHPLFPFMLANFDRIVKLPDGSYCLLEIKTTTSHNKDAWADGKVPAAYIWQCRHYMAILNIDKIYIACLYGNTPSDYVCSSVERDLIIEEDLINVEQEFWEHVELGIEPEAIGDPALAVETFRAYNGYAKKNTVDLPQSVEGNVKEYLQLRAKRKALETQVDLVKSQEATAMFPIIKVLNQDTNGVLKTNDVTYYVKYTPRKQVKIDKEKLEKDFKDAFDKCVEVIPEASRTFAITESIKTK